MIAGPRIKIFQFLKYSTLFYATFYFLNLLVVPVFVQAAGSSVLINSSFSASPNPADNTVTISGSGAASYDTLECNTSPGGFPYWIVGTNLRRVYSVVVYGTSTVFPGQPLTITSNSNYPNASCPSNSSGPNNFAASGTFDTSALANGSYTVPIQVCDNQGSGTFSCKNFDVSFTVNHPPPPTGTVCIQSNVTTQVITSGGSGYSDNIGGGAGYTCHPNASLTSYTATGSSLGGYTGPTYNAQTQSLSSNGQTIYFDLTYTANAPPPPGGPSCSPSTQTVQIGTVAGFSAAGGNGSFSWSAPGGSPASGTDSNFSTTYSTSGTKTVTVTSNSQSATCSVSLSSNPPPPPPPSSSPPTCTSGAPQSATTTATSGDFYIYAYGVANATSVIFPTWSSVNGQDDISWYSGTNLGGGTWRATVNLANHRVGNPDSGQFYSQIYMSNSAYTNSYCGDASFIRDRVPIGVLDVPTMSTPSCQAIAGWAFDPDTSSQPIGIHMYKDNPAGSGTFVDTKSTTGSRPDVNAAFGITGNHGYGWYAPLPTSLLDGGNHTVYLYAINSNPAGNNSFIGQGTVSGCYGPCVGSSTQSCTSDANACNQTSSGTQSRTCTNGAWSGWGACSASPPVTPAPVACTGATSSANSCGDTNLGGPGTITCSGNSTQSACSGAAGSTPAERTNYGASCTGATSAPNACGQTSPGGSGTYVCNGGANSGLGTSCNAVNGVTPPNSSCPAPVPSISCTPGTVGYGGSSTIGWACPNSSSGSVSPTGWTGTSNPGISTGALTSNQIYTVTCVGFNGSNPTASCPVTVSSPTVTISNNQTLPWNSSPTISWTPANAGTCTATNGTTGWAGSRDASSGAHSWTAPSPITTPGTYAYSIQCFGNGSSALVTSFITIQNPVPTVGPGDPTYSPSDYCSGGPGGFVTWSYSDPANSPQSAYEVQISKTGEFSNPFYTYTSGPTSSHVFSIPEDVLDFGFGYKARVRVWNTYSSVSAWSNPTNTFNTPNYAYPGVRPPYEFYWLTPPKPQQNKPLQFNDRATFGGGNVNNRQWVWNFGDGGSLTCNNISCKSPTHTYTAVGNYTISETVTDAANQTCSYSQSLNVIKPIPIIKEVAPK